MSYDLYFWKQSEKCTTTPSQIIDAFCEELEVEGIERIPTERILRRLREEFPDIYENHTTNPNNPVQLIWGDEDTESSFYLGWSDFYISVEGHRVDGETYNRIIDVAAEFDCKLYDPQTDTRYTG